MCVWVGGQGGRWLTGAHCVALAGLGLSMQTRLAPNSESCLRELGVALCPWPYDLEPFDFPVSSTKH